MLDICYASPLSNPTSPCCLSARRTREGQRRCWSVQCCRRFNRFVHKINWSLDIRLMRIGNGEADKSKAEFTSVQCSCESILYPQTVDTQTHSRKSFLAAGLMWKRYATVEHMTAIWSDCEWNLWCNSYDLSLSLLAWHSPVRTHTSHIGIGPTEYYDDVVYSVLSIDHICLRWMEAAMKPFTERPNETTHNVCISLHFPQ